jgi:hypothetical protein
MTRVNSKHCSKTYIFIYVNHLRCEEIYKFSTKMYLINLTDLKYIIN